MTPPDDALLAHLHGAVERCTPAELAVASGTLRHLDESLPANFPANSARVITAVRFVLDSALTDQVRALVDLGLTPDIHLDGSETITERIMRTITTEEHP